MILKFHIVVAAVPPGRRRPGPRPAGGPDRPPGAGGLARATQRPGCPRTGSPGRGAGRRARSSFDSVRRRRLRRDRHWHRRDAGSPARRRCRVRGTGTVTVTARPGSRSVANSVTSCRAALALRLPVTSESRVSDSPDLAGNPAAHS